MNNAATQPEIDHQGVVILATDTEVGKTFIGCALAQALRHAGIVAKARKPVETGCASEDGQLVPADGRLLWAAAGKVEPLDIVCPLRFSLPVAAPQAARHADTSLEFERDIAPILRPATHPANDNVPSAKSFWIIESAGGALSPLTDDHFNVQLALFTKLPVILVAPDRLGTLSTLFAHIESLAHRGITIAAIVLNQRPKQQHADNVVALNTWLPRLLSAYPHSPLPAVLSIAQGADQHAVGVQLLNTLNIQIKP